MDWYEETFGLGPVQQCNVLDPELGDPERCEFCEERFRPSSEVGEFAHPTDAAVDTKVGHADCGLSAGWHVA